MRKKPCKECPFRRDNSLSGENPGGASPYTYIGQSEGPFWLPCHMEKNYAGKETDPKSVSQCAGAAIYRTHIGVAEKMPKQIVTLPENHEQVFSSHGEFLAHYLKISPFVADTFVKVCNVAAKALEHEITQSQVKRVEL